MVSTQELNGKAELFLEESERRKRNTVKKYEEGTTNPESRRVRKDWYHRGREKTRKSQGERGSRSLGDDQ